jgi:hypothetical protein
VNGTAKAVPLFLGYTCLGIIRQRYMNKPDCCLFYSLFCVVNPMLIAMEKIEIRQNKKTAIPILAIMVAGMLVMSYFIFFRVDSENATIKVVCGIIMLLMFYGLYLPVRRLITNEPVLILCQSEITILEKNKPVSFLWIQVTGWRIEDESEGPNHNLVLETTEGKRKVDISLLELDPDEIEELLNQYKNADRERTLSNQTQ